MKEAKKFINNDTALVYIKTTQNNTIITVTSSSGNALFWFSSGICGFKGAEKGTPFASQVTAEASAMKALSFGIKNIKIFFSGNGDGRESALEPFINSFDVFEVQELKKIPFNGCRPPKKRKL